MGWPAPTLSSDKTIAVFETRTNVTSGVVTVNIINSNCSSTNSAITFNVSRPGATPIINGPDVVQPNYYGDFIAPDGNSYSWTMPSGWSIHSGDGTQTVYIQAPSMQTAGGYMSVTYNDACGQPQTASKFVSTQTYDSNLIGGTKSTIQGVVSELDEDDKQSIVAYPNPAMSYLSLPRKVTNIQLANINGKIVLQTQHTDIRLDVTQVPNGLYELRFQQGGKIISQRIQIKH